MHFSHCRFSFSRKAPLELSFFLCATIAVIVKKILQPLRVSWPRCIFLTLPYKGTVHSKMKQSLQKHKMALWGSSCVIEDSGSPKLHKWILKDIIYTFFRVKFNLQLQGKVCKGVHNIFQIKLGSMCLIYAGWAVWTHSLFSFSLVFFSFHFFMFIIEWTFGFPSQRNKVGYGFDEQNTWPQVLMEVFHILTWYGLWEPKKSLTD